MNTQAWEQRTAVRACRAEVVCFWGCLRETSVCHHAVSQLQLPEQTQTHAPWFLSSCKEDHQVLTWIQQIFNKKCVVHGHVPHKVVAGPALLIKLWQHCRSSTFDES